MATHINDLMMIKDGDHVPWGCDFVRAIVVQTDQEMPKSILIKCLYTGDRKMFDVELVRPGWYKIDIPTINLTGFGIRLDDMPKPNKLFFKITSIYPRAKFGHRKMTNFKIRFARPKYHVTIHVKHVCRIFRHECMTHISWKDCDALPISIKVQEYVLFQLPDADWRTAAEIISGGPYFYFGTSIRVQQIDKITVTTGNVSKEFKKN